MIVEQIFESYFENKTKPVVQALAELKRPLFENCCERRALLNVNGEVLF